MIAVGSRVYSPEDGGDSGRVLQVREPSEVVDGPPEYAGSDGRRWLEVGWDSGVRTWIAEDDVTVVS